MTEYAPITRRMCVNKEGRHKAGAPYNEMKVHEIAKLDGHVWVARQASPAMAGGQFIPSSKWANRVMIVDTKALKGLRGAARQKKLRDLHLSAVQAFKNKLTEKQKAEIKASLSGKTLMCWCPIELPCHADVLVNICDGY